MNGPLFQSSIEDSDSFKSDSCHSESNEPIDKCELKPNHAQQLKEKRRFSIKVFKSLNEAARKELKNKRNDKVEKLDLMQ